MTTTSPEPLDTEDAAAWEDLLAIYADGLDLSRGTGRAVFVSRVNRAVPYARVHHLGRVARYFGATDPGRTRATATRAIAEAWIARQSRPTR